MKCIGLFRRGRQTSKIECDAPGSVRRSASGDGCKPSRASRSRMNPSIGFPRPERRAAAPVDKPSGPRTSRLPPPTAGWSPSARPSVLYAQTQAASRARLWRRSAPRWRSSRGSPGTIGATPLWLGFEASSRMSSRIPAMREPLSGPWQRKQVSAMMGRISRLKRTSKTKKHAKTKQNASLKRNFSFLFRKNPAAPLLKTGGGGCFMLGW